MEDTHKDKLGMEWKVGCVRGICNASATHLALAGVARSKTDIMF